MDRLDRWLIERMLLVLFAALLVHTIDPSQEFLVQMFGAILGLATYQILSAIIGVIRAH